MPRIYTFGEALMDITFRDGQPVSAWPGGAMLNTSVSLGRMGLPVSLITEYGRDKVGDLIDDFLKENGIDTDHVARFEGHRTTLALAFLDENSNAEYSFYKDYPERRLQSRRPHPSKGDLFLFGSFFALDGAIRPVLTALLKEARDQGAFIYYDPNFRSSHLDELPALKKDILENIGTAHLVRGSDEDFRNILGAADARGTYEKIREYCPYLIYTASSSAVYLHTPRLSMEVPVPPVKVVSTVGAGDTFNAGIASELYQRKITPGMLDSLEEEEWREILSTGIRLAGEVCGRYENYVENKF